MMWLVLAASLVAVWGLAALVRFELGPQEDVARLWSQLTTVFTAVGSTILIAARLAGATWAPALERFVAFAPCVSFALDLGTFDLPLREALHHTLGIVGTLYLLYLDRITVVAVLLFDSTTLLARVWLVRGFGSALPGRRSPTYFAYWVAVRIVAYPLVLVWFILHADSFVVAALLAAWLVFSSVFHAVQLPALARFHWSQQ